VPTEFTFLKDAGESEHKMRLLCSTAAKTHRIFMKELIAKLDR